MIYRKYSFPIAQWEALKLALEVETTSLDATTHRAWNTEIVAAVADIGFICDELAANEHGNMTCVAYSPGYAVDILWQGEPMAAFHDYVVWPAGLGVHIFSGWEGIYQGDRALHI